MELTWPGTVDGSVPIKKGSGATGALFCRIANLENSAYGKIFDQAVVSPLSKPSHRMRSEVMQ